LTTESLDFVRELLGTDIDKIALENPIGCISTRIRKPDQTIQPWQFGDDASKATCLWLKNLPLLAPTNVIVKARYANQTPSGQNKLGPGPTRARERARTYQGIANAMAAQWGGPAWQPVVFAADCDEDGMCPKCRNLDYSECPCIGPTEDGYEYEERDGVMWGRRV
jgi:hypothetical protein